MTERDETGRGRVLAVAALLILSVVAPAFAGAAVGAPEDVSVTSYTVSETAVNVTAGSEPEANVSVVLEPSQELLRTGGVGQFDVVLNGTSGGVGSVNLTVTTENASRVEITRAASSVADNANVSVTADENGTSVTVDIERGNTSDTGNVTLAVIEVRARAPTVSGPPSFVGGSPETPGPPGSGDDGEASDDYDFANVSAGGLANLSVTVNDLADENGSEYAVDATGNASVVVEPGPPAEPPGLEKARDLDGDGTYDDLNGDGRTNVVDAAVMMREQSTIESMPENARLGFDESGDGRFNVVDVAVFLQEL